MSEITLKLGLDVLRSYRRLAYLPWYALAEFVDNSTQSYFNNRKALNAAYASESTKLTVEINYDRAAGVLTVKDNAMGMSADDLRGALHIGKPPAVVSGRSQFGLGMKTAAGWFADVWSVRTKKLGETTGHHITIDVEKIVEGQDPVLPDEPFKAKVTEHFTEIRMENLHQVLQGRRLGKTKEFLKSMYRVDARKGKLDLRWDGEPLKWDDKIAVLEDPPGIRWVKLLRFKVGKHRVVGKVMVLAPGSSGRSNAGFAIIRRGRLIRGWPEPWKPESIFGPYEGSNDLINQRVAGEFVLNDFDVTHTKDDILFEGDEEDLVQDGIKERIGNLLEKARTYRQKLPADPRSHRVDLEAAVKSAGLDVRVASIKLALDGLLQQKTKPSAIAAALNALSSRAAMEPTMMEVQLSADAKLRVIVSEALPREAPYALVQEVSSAEWLLVVNAGHPVCGLMNGGSAVHVEHLVADSAALWAAQRQKRDLSPPQWIVIKDAVLRGMSEDE